MKKKKGFTVIELMISLLIVSEICMVSASFITRLSVQNKIFLNKSKEQFYVDEGLNYIQYLADISNEFTVYNNKIKLKRMDNTAYDWVRKASTGNIVISYGSNYSTTVNTVVKNIKDFKVKQIGKVIYITITDKKGEVYCRSIIKQ